MCRYKSKSAGTHAMAVVGRAGGQNGGGVWARQNKGRKGGCGVVCGWGR